MGFMDNVAPQTGKMPGQPAEFRCGCGFMAETQRGLDQHKQVCERERLKQHLILPSGPPAPITLGHTEISPKPEIKQEETPAPYMSRPESILAILQDGPLTTAQIADKAGVSVNLANTYLLRLKKKQSVQVISNEDKKRMYALATANLDPGANFPPAQKGHKGYRECPACHQLIPSRRSKIHAASECPAGPSVDVTVEPEKMEPSESVADGSGPGPASDECPKPIETRSFDERREAAMGIVLKMLALVPTGKLGSVRILANGDATDWHVEIDFEEE